MTLQVDSMLESGSLLIIEWILLGNPRPAKLILHHWERFPSEPIGSALEFDTLCSWDLSGKGLLDVNVFKPTVRPTLQPL